MQERKDKAKEMLIFIVLKLNRLKESFSEVDVAVIVRKIEQTLYQDRERGELVDLGGKVYIFPTVFIYFYYFQMQFPGINYF